jgi:hypothetical protein
VNVIQDSKVLMSNEKLGSCVERISSVEKERRERRARLATNMKALSRTPEFILKLLYGHEIRCIEQDFDQMPLSMDAVDELIDGIVKAIDGL